MSWSPPAYDPALRLREHLPEAGWREAMREICARHGLQEAALSPFASGSDVVWATGDRVVKLSAPRWGTP